jgi:hypothetical protein
MSWRRPDAGASTTSSAFAPANGAEEDAAMEEEVFDDSAQTDGDAHNDQDLHVVEDTQDEYEGPADEPPTVLKNKGFWSSKEGNDLWEQVRPLPPAAPLLCTPTDSPFHPRFSHLFPVTPVDRF